ncbi:UNVERIFIED_CONTAM: hypothetical protein FKN15_034861 [Acipenser sinensis]
MARPLDLQSTQTLAGNLDPPAGAALVAPLMAEVGMTALLPLVAGTAARLPLVAEAGTAAHLPLAILVASEVRMAPPAIAVRYASTELLSAACARAAEGCQPSPLPVLRSVAPPLPALGSIAPPLLALGLTAPPPLALGMAVPPPLTLGTAAQPPVALGTAAPPPLALGTAAPPRGSRDGSSTSSGSWDGSSTPSGSRMTGASPMSLARYPDHQGDFLDGRRVVLPFPFIPPPPISALQGFEPLRRNILPSCGRRPRSGHTSLLVTPLGRISSGGPPSHTRNTREKDWLGPPAGVAAAFVAPVAAAAACFFCIFYFLTTKKC